MRLTQLCTEAGLTDAAVTGDAEVGRVVIDSRNVREGDCFVAVRGTATDGHRYVVPAVAAGCAAVVCEDPTAVPPGIPFAVVANVRAATGRLAQAILGWPARKLTVIGVTGTNGKTTFTYMVRAVLDAAGHRTAVFGTISYDMIGATRRAFTTTPSPIELAEMMDQVARNGGTHVAMEVSSHALDQDRTAGIDLAVGVYTNLTGDHLDYHGDMDRYLAAKRRMFEDLSPSATAVINRDDRYADKMAAATRAKVLWYGLSSAADVCCGRVVRVDPDGSEFTLRHGGREAPVRLLLAGQHNIANALAAAGAAIALGVPLETIADALARIQTVPGRLQRVPGDAPFTVLVDYAHTDDAMRNVLAALSPVKRNARLILVFGCGGDRDRTKRPRMAEAAEEYADQIVLTSDNPRSEDPARIIEEIAAGFSQAGRAKTLIEPDRRKAIEAAIAQARPGDVVLIAGKGHETYQILGNQRIHFDDVETAEEILRGR